MTKLAPPLSLLVASTFCFWALTGCKKHSEPHTNSAVVVASNPAVSGSGLNQVVAVKDPVQEESYAFRLKVRQAYNSSRFDELETTAGELRRSKATFGNGAWKIVKFYGAFACRKDEPDSMWQLHERLHKDWIAAKPVSITARVAYADFLIDYAWLARGNGYAQTVTPTGSSLFTERLAAARTVLAEARSLPETDPVWWLVALNVALGQGWPKADYDALVREAKSVTPGLYDYDTVRAYSLLPRWYGEPGDWESYALMAAEESNGFGAEIYARIVFKLHGYYDNVFKESRATWPKTREGLEQLRLKYPETLEIVNHAGLLASLAGDQVFALKQFEVMGDQYLPSVWQSAETFIQYRTWAKTGK